MNARFLIFISISLLFFGSCGREQQIPVPYVYVNHTVYLNNPSNDNLRVPGGYQIIHNQGNHGILLYRISIGDYKDFVAFDLTCTHEPTDTCKLFMDETDLYLECPCCGSKFTAFDGFVAQGPARWQLKQYQTAFNGNTVRIYN